MEEFKNAVEWCGIIIDALGVLVIVAGVAVAATRAAYLSSASPYRTFRQEIGKAILLGLELLVAGDIIRTVAVSPTIENVYVLGLIVLIRTFLSTALQIELEGQLPWNKNA